MIRRLLRPQRVAKLREARQAAERRLHEAQARRDTRRVHEAAAALKQATHALLREELRL
jgi:hypothetical protein